jgi:drug/metabolite transporter (DMT)-like permease
MSTDTPYRRTGSLRWVADRPVLAALAGACCIASSGVLVRLADVAPATAAVFRCAYALPVLFALAARERRRLGPRTAPDRRLALLAGIAFAVDLVLWHHTIEAVGAGLATVLGNLQVVFVGLAAWALLGERPERGLMVAVPMVLTGVVLLSGVLGTGAYGQDPALGVALGVATSLAYAAFILLLRRSNRDVRRPAGPLADATAVAAVVSVVLGVFTGGVDLVPSWPAHGWLLLLAGTSQVVGWLLLSVSLPRLPAALPSLLLLVQPIGALYFGVLLLGESPSAVQFAGVAVIGAGVLLATAGRWRGAPAPAR